MTPQPGEALRAKALRQALDYFTLTAGQYFHTYGNNEDPIAELEAALAAPVAGEGLTPYLFVSSCDWGDCHEPTIAIRHNDGEWLSVCRLHVADAKADEVAPIVSSLVAADQPVAEERT